MQGNESCEWLQLRHVDKKTTIVLLKWFVPNECKDRNALACVNAYKMCHCLPFSAFEGTDDHSPFRISVSRLSLVRLRVSVCQMNHCSLFSAFESAEGSQPIPK